VTFLSAVATVRLDRYRLAVFAILILLLGGFAATSGASAQPVAQASPAASPAPDATAAGAAAPTPGPQEPGPAVAPPRTAPQSAPRKFGHLPIIDIIPVFTDPQFYTVGPITKTGQPAVNPLKSAGVGYDPLDVGGSFKLPITPMLSASFDRVVEGTLNVPDARVTNAEHKYVYNVYSRDVVLVTRLDEQFKRLQFEEGLYFRHRIAGGSQTSNNPLLPTIASREAHIGYVGVTYATGGIPWLLNSFITLNINADTQAVDHHVGCLLKALDGVAVTCPKGNTTGFIDENPAQDRVWETDQYVQLTIPVDKKHGLTLVGQDRWGALNFYENAPFPYRWTTSQTYLLTKRFNRVFSLSLRARDQWAVASGSPYVKPNAQHNGTIDVLADFKVDTNTLH
jgi:hypothetical protein